MEGNHVCKLYRYVFTSGAHPQSTIDHVCLKNIRAVRRARILGHFLVPVIPLWEMKKRCTEPFLGLSTPLARLRQRPARRCRGWASAWIWSWGTLISKWNRSSIFERVPRIRIKIGEQRGLGILKARKKIHLWDLIQKNTYRGFRVSRICGILRFLKLQPPKSRISDPTVWGTFVEPSRKTNTTVGK